MGKVIVLTSPYSYVVTDHGVRQLRKAVVPTSASTLKGINFYRVPQIACQSSRRFVAGQRGLAAIHRVCEQVDDKGDVVPCERLPYISQPRMRFLRNRILLTFLAIMHTSMFTSNAYSDILRVPHQFQTIQEAINRSSPDDTILVAPGEYRLPPGNITIDKESLILKSRLGAAKTILKGSGNSSVITLAEGSRVVIEGFTITTESGVSNPALRGGGIYCAPSSYPVIIKNIITGNSAVFGGAIYCDRLSTPAIIDNVISKNKATGFGGGIFSYRASPNINRNRLVENEAANSGGGISCNWDSPRITHNIIWKNKAKFGGGVSCDRSSATFINDTITANKGVYGGGIFIDRGSVRITNLILWQNKDDLYYKLLSHASRPDHSNIGDGDFQGLNGNFSTDPLFKDPENDDFRLKRDSPCKNAGNPEPIYYDPDGSRNDMGAYGGSKRLRYIWGGTL